MIIYALAGTKLRGIVLILGSLVFYYLGAGWFDTALLAAVIVINFFIAGAIEMNSGGTRKFLLIFALVLDFGLLLYYKYAGYFSSIFVLTENVGAYLAGLIMPLGMSFYIFSLTSYVIDVYRSYTAHERSFLRYAEYALMFPKLISGPIVRYRELRSELRETGITRKNLEDGFCTFTIGLGYKILLADNLATIWEYIRQIGFENISTPLAWIGVLGYSLQLYFDFNGYSLMAMGIGKMMGFTFPLNFDLPYLSTSVSEFWRRWHITLGAWFRDYVYIPLGGSKKGTLRLIISLTAVWLLTGIWHGSSLNFLLWGMSILVFILLERFAIGGFLKKHSILAHLYVCFVIPQTWIIFAIPDIKDIGYYFQRLYPFIGKSGEFVYELDYVDALSSGWWMLAAGVLLCLPFARKLYMKHQTNVITVLVLFAVFWASVYMIVQHGSNPFMYFAF